MQNTLKVLYEDNHVIAVFKPAGVLSQGDHTGDESMFDQVKKYLKEKYKKPGNVFLGLVHRLDRPVSGIMLFAKTSKGAARLSEQFRNHSIQKTYYGIIVGKPAVNRGDIKGKVKKISFFAEGFSHKSDQQILEEIKRATKTRTAELYYEVVASNGKYSLVKILPKTGRFHQIRIQMSQIGAPILGDVKHGGEKWKDEKSPDGKAIEDPRQRRDIALCATNLEFKPPTSANMVKISVEMPKEWHEYLK